MTTIINIYILINITYLISQFILACIYHLKNKNINNKQIKNLLEEKNLRISIIYPIYNEKKEVLNDVFYHALLAIDENMEIIFIDDGSDNTIEIKEVYDNYFVNNKNTRLIHQKNKGKREAQNTALDYCTGDIIVTVDSDTHIYRYGIYQLIYPFLIDKKIGSTTGYTKVLNNSTNLLTELTAQRYSLAFNVERASQSVTNSVLCNCGAFSAYKKEFLLQVRHDYTNQKFLGEICTYGDDRHLTNLVLSKGLKTIYVKNAVAHTIVPEKLGQFTKQQTRWNKSFFREILWTNKFVKNVSIYSYITMLASPVLTLLLLVSLANAINLMLYNPILSIRYVIIIMLTAYIRAIFGMIIDKDWKYLYYPLYSFIHLFLLVPLKFKALFNMKDGAWGTRGKNIQSNTKIQNVLTNTIKWVGITYLIVLLILIII